MKKIIANMNQDHICNILKLDNLTFMIKNQMLVSFTRSLIAWNHGIFALSYGLPCIWGKVRIG